MSQPQYGDGTVASANEFHTTIEFDGHGARTFATPLVKLERSDTPAPVRVKGARKKKTAKVKV